MAGMDKRVLRVILLFLCVWGVALGGLRNVDIGDVMPEFSLMDLDGSTVNYTHGQDKIVIAAFLKAEQVLSERVFHELQKISQRYHPGKTSLRIFVIFEDENNKDKWDALQREIDPCFPILLDKDMDLWGELGIIAVPTVLLVDQEDKIRWIKAGYNMNFSNNLQEQIDKLLGVNPKTSAEGTKVKSLINDTGQARMERHLRMAKMLKKKGLYNAAVIELRKAQKILPAQPVILLELAQLLCRTGKANAAQEVLAKVKVSNRLDRARVKLLDGWAARLRGDLPQAETALKESIRLDPDVPRTWFELGKIYQLGKRQKLAADTYRRALELVFHEPITQNDSQK